MIQGTIRDTLEAWRLASRERSLHARRTVITPDGQTGSTSTMVADPTEQKTPESTRLLVDTMLGKLAVYLRMCGYDAADVGDRDSAEEEELIQRARTDGRVLLTRDVQLASMAPTAMLVSEREVEEQLSELREAGFELDLADPPKRCGRCNGPLEPVPDGVERPAYAPSPDEFDCWWCIDCGQFFWKGSHWDRVGAVL